MREKSGRARKREDESPSVGGGRKSARRKKDEETAGGRKATRWKGGGSRRVEDGWVAASKGCQGGVRPAGAAGVAKGDGKTRGGQGRGPTGLENSPLFLLTLARCLIASYFRIFRVELSIETRERGFVCVLSPTALVVYSPLFIPVSFPPPTFSLRFSLGRPPRSVLFSLSFSLSRFLSFSAPPLPPSSSTTSSTSPTSTPSAERERERERAPCAPARRPPLGGLFKTTHSRCVRRRTGSAQGRLAHHKFLS